MATSPVTPPSTTRSPRRLRRRRTVLAAAVLLLAGAGFVLGSEHVVLSTTDTVGGVRELVVDIDAGNVVLRTGAGPDVTVRTSRYGWTLGGRGTGHRLEAGVLTVEADCDGSFGSCHVQEELTVPPGVGVRVRTDAGAIEAVDLDVTRFDAETGAGAVSASFASPPAEVRAATSAGDVVLRVPDAAYDVDADSATGTARVEVATDPHAPRTLSAYTTAGDVAVLPR